MRNLILKDLFYDFKPSFFVDDNVRGRFWQKTDTGFKLELDIPGVKKEDIKLSIDKRILSVKAERKIKERSFMYSSDFSVPEGLNEESVEAEYVSGVLIITGLSSVAKESKLITIK